MPAKKRPAKKPASSAAHRCAVTLGRLGGLATAKKRRAGKKRARR